MANDMKAELNKEKIQAGQTIDMVDYVNNTSRRYEILEKLKEENKNE